MKRLIIIFVLFCLILKSEAQKFQGVAVYQYLNNYSDEDWSKKQMSDADIAKWKAKLSQESRTTYELLFTPNESSWEETDALSMNKEEKWSEWGKPLIKLLYKNFEEQTYLMEAELFDKAFLVADELTLPDWQLTNETKMIGNYTVKKAIWEIEEEVMVFGSEEKEIEISHVVAWYAPQIPVPQGPAKFWGLPGLILEVQNGPITFICEKVTLNPDDAIKIKVPSFGQKVTQSELDKIATEKMEEILKRYNKTGKKGK